MNKDNEEIFRRVGEWFWSIFLALLWLAFIIYIGRK